MEKEKAEAMGGVGIEAQFAISTHTASCLFGVCLPNALFSGRKKEEKLRISAVCCHYKHNNIWCRKVGERNKDDRLLFDARIR